VNGPRTYATVLALAIVAVVGRAMLDPVLADRARYVVPLVIVIVAAVAGGRGPAILAAIVTGVGTLLTAVAGDTAPSAEILPAALFGLGVGAIVVLTERLRGAQAAAESQAGRLADVVADRDRAIEREGRERDVAERRARLLETTLGISLEVTAPTLAPDVAGRVLDIAMGALGAATGSVAHLADDGRSLRMVAMRGYPAPAVEALATIPTDADLPIARVARTRRAEWLTEPDGQRARMAAGDDLGSAGEAAMLPLESGGRAFGVLTIGLPTGQPLLPDDRAFLGLVARRIAQALDRARLERARRQSDQAERERAAQLRAVIDTIEDGIAVVAGPAILVRNASLTRLVGEVRTVDDLARVLGLDSVGVDDAGSVRTIERIGPGGERSWLELRVYPVDAESGSSRLEAILVVRDVTTARAELAMRDAFVGMLSHELRTPVTVILGSASFLARRLPAGDSRLELVGDIAAESERMGRLIDDLLVVSQPDSVPLPPEPVLVHHLVNSVAAAIHERHPYADLAVDTPPGLPPAAGDPTLVEQVVRNLVGNAIKFGGSRPVVRVMAREAGDEIEVVVEDEGPGVPEDDREAVFDIFYRSRATAARASGAGIGLFVCRRLVEAMGGRIWVGPGTAGGARFTFVIPSYSAAAPERRGTAASS
jgi:K+-sensing histidine kinase KdpD